MKLYRELLADAWTYTSQRPSLWILGFFTALLAGTSGEIDRYFRYSSALVSQANVLNPEFWTEARWFIVVATIFDQLQDGNIALWVFMVLVAVAAVLVVLMMVIAQGGLIYAAAHPTTAHFDTAFAAGRKHIGPLVVLNLAAYAAVVPLLFVFSNLMIRSNLGGSFASAQTFAFVAGAIIFLPYIIIVALVGRYAAHAIVLQDAHLGRAIWFGWKLFKKNWLVSIEMALSVFVVGLFFNVMLVLAAGISVAPYLMTALMKLPVGETITSQIYDAIFVGLTVYVLGLMIFSAIFTTWQWAAWTNLFQRLLREKPTGTLLRVLGGNLK